MNTFHTHCTSYEIEAWAGNFALPKKSNFSLILIICKNENVSKN